MEGAANSLRGEVSLTLGGRTFTLRPSFAAIVTVEERLGSVIALALKASKGELGVKETTALLWETFDQKATMTEEELGGLILDEGVAAVAPTVSALLAAILKGSRHAEP